MENENSLMIIRFKIQFARRMTIVDAAPTFLNFALTCEQMFDRMKPRNFTCVFVLRKVARTWIIKKKLKN